MWINLDKEQLELISATARAAGTVEQVQIADEIDEKLASGFDPANEAWVAKAKEIHQDEGQVEVDEQSDGSAMVSENGENGAYVLAWVFVDYEDMGMQRPQPTEDDEEDDED